MSKANLQPTKITQPLAGKRIQNSKGKNIKSPSVCRDGNADPAYHPWEIGSLNNFLTGKQIQCGRKSTYHCNLKTVRWIKGYRNTCPIAGCCGTFNRPAPLILSKFNFAKKQISKKIKISNVKISYKHHVTGVNVALGKGSETKNWAGYFPYVDITLYRYDGNNKEEHKIQTIRHNKTIPLAKDATVNANFTKDINNFNPLKDDLRIEINYPANGAGQYYDKATNPSILYAKDLNINVEYEYIETPQITQISVSGGKNTLITDPRKPNNSAGTLNCRDTFSHTVKYSHTTASDIVVTVPTGVKYTRKLNNGSIIYTYQDISGKAGQKTITYSLKSDKNKKITKTYTAKLYTKPTISIQSQYIKNQAYQAQDKFIKVSNNCWNNIKIYVDGNEQLLIQYNYDTIDEEAFLEAINNLSCGYHILNVYIDDVFAEEIRIYIKAPQITFESDLEGEYKQNTDTKYKTITITRTDNNQLNGPIEITIVDIADNEVPPQTAELYPTETITQDINISQAGTFELQYSYNNGCGMQYGSFGKYIVRPLHTQVYDYLLIRGNDVPIEYESIVVRKGDNQTKPVTYISANLVNSMNDIVLFGKDGVCALGELGYGILAVKNTSAQTINNLCIELNPLIDSDNNEEYNPLVMEWKTGMLQNFVDNFQILNSQFKDLIDIYNIQNQNLINEGTENVVLCIKEIKGSNEDNIIELKIPFSYSYEKEIYMNFLLLGEPTDFVDLDNIYNNAMLYNNEEFYYYTGNYRSNNLFASQTSKQRDRGCMCISLKTMDLISTELSITGDDLDRNDLENNDDLDIEYHIKLSDADCDNNTSSSIKITSQIINDARLIPTAYQIDNGERQEFEFKDKDGNVTNNTNAFITAGNIISDPISVTRGVIKTDTALSAADVFLRYLDKDNNIKYMRTQTDANGIAKFKYMIPSYYDTKDTYYLTDILQKIDIVYQGDDMHNSAQLTDTVNALQNTNLTIWGVVYYLDDDTNTAIFVPQNQFGGQILSNVKDIYVVGQLENEDDGINEQIIQYNYQNQNQQFSRQGITRKNELSLFGEDKKDVNGFFQIKINQPNITTYNLSNIWNNSCVYYDGDLWNQESMSGFSDKKIIYDKHSTTMEYIHDYGLYRKGEIIEIKVKLLSLNEKQFVNNININHKIMRCSQTVHIFYQTCSAKNIEGFKTIFKTTSSNVIPNEVSAIIFCGVDTDLKILAKLQKKVVENHNINILTINAINGYKPNKDVVVKAIIGPEAEKQKLGDYLALSAVDIDKEKYSYDQSSDIIYWKIGDMDSYETQICNILLEGEHIGNNTIYVLGFDYLHLDEEQIIETEMNLSIMEGFEKEQYYIDDDIQLKAVLTGHIANQENNQPKTIYGRIKFKKYIYDETQDEYVYKEIVSIADIQNYNGEHYAIAHIRLKDIENTKIYAVYEGATILSTTYESVSDTDVNNHPVIFENISKYDTIVQLSSEQESFKTNEPIVIDASVLYDNDKLYFDKDLNIKIFIEGQELTSILHYDKKYHVNFMITQAGEYMIRAFIPDTRKTSESYANMIINVENGENNE